MNINEKQIAKVLVGLITNQLQKLDNEKDFDRSSLEEDLDKVLENSFNYMEAEGWVTDWEKL
jgi:hypothetical protein